MNRKYISWGRYPVKSQKGVELSWRHSELPADHNFLPQGNARSYGDCCMNADGIVVSTTPLRNLVSFNADTGVLRCESGVTLKDILDVFEPRGWFLPVTPGTKFATIGGAIANDVHGKNHHVAGTFGCHVLQFELLRSDGTRRICSPNDNAALFSATIGGLGLTGVVIWADILLRRVENSAIKSESFKYANLQEFFSLSEESESTHEYTMAWVDCLAGGTSTGRGHFIRGNHASYADARLPHKPLPLAIPFDPPVSLVNPLSLKLFNALYYHRQRSRVVSSLTPYDPFFYPLDGIRHWNRMYGPKGFLQYQLVLPMETSEEGVTEVLGRIAASRAGSFLAVLKVFGSRPSPGIMSFPRPGTTLALDFPFQGEKTHSLFRTLDEVVRQAGGAIYPAKDAHMSADDFRRYYPRWKELLPWKDPNINSSFWKRVAGENAA
jgi:FAD/FMN-containing dehydrogenase